MSSHTTEQSLTEDLREHLRQGRCLCSSAHTDWVGVAGLLDRLEKAEEQVRRVEDTIAAFQDAHTHLGVHRDQFGPSVAALKVALTLPAATLSRRETDRD